MQPTWVKLCTKDLKCRKLQLTLGANVDVHKYNITLCKPGGLHFCEDKDAPQWAHVLDYGWVCDVTIPPDAEVTHGFKQSKASKLILSNHRPLWSQPDIYLAAVQHDGRMLRHVPNNIKTPTLCSIAVQQNKYSLRYVPEGLKTFEMCLAAVQRCGWALANVPADLKTAGMCLTAVRHYGNALEHVPVGLQTFGVCLAAVQQDGRSLEHVPVELKTVELCLVAVQKTSQALACNIAKLLGQFSRHARKADGLQHYCKFCDAERKKRYANTKQGFICQLVQNARGNSERRIAKGREHGIPTITPDTIKSLAKNGRCALSGISIVFKQYSKWQASLDRIDDDKGYHPDNVRLVALEFNNAQKWTLSKFNGMFREDVFALSVEPVSFTTPINTYQPRSKVFDDQGRLQCWDCQVFKPLDAFGKALSHGCKTCNSSRTRASNNTPRGRLQRLVSSARLNHNHRLKRNRNNPDRADAGPCDITFDQLVGLYEHQGGRCFYSGMPLGFSGDGDWLVSLERLDVTKSYTLTNVALICVQLNAMDNGIQSGNTDQGWSRAKVEEIRELCKK